ncbi:MAG: undecaprenyl-diphosphate phosphatase [Pirellulaceae bacterium]|nr:undecaprenyl-diphosphate phosphatase [Pirellulaceae bacterium]
MELWVILVLAVVQGVTEFLPISSSGHVVLGGALLSGGNVDDLDIADVNIVLHAGTLGAIVIVYFKKIKEIVWNKPKNLYWVVVGSVPAAIVGIGLKVSGYDSILEKPILAALMLIVTGIVLLSVRKYSFETREESLQTKEADRPKGGTPHLSYQELGLKGALTIGFFQAFAILPGISRSGITIVAGLRQKLAPSEAATYSFLLAIVAIGGASLLEIREIATEASLTTPISSLAIGALVSLVVGYFSLLLLLRFLEGGKLWIFVFWCLPVGGISLVWQLLLM